MLPFTKRKFLSLTPEKRHKECALLIKQIYELLLKKGDPSPLFGRYREWLSWMDRKACTCDIKSLADAYHRHINLSGQYLKEKNFLPRIETKDKNSSSPPLNGCIVLDNIRSAHNVGSMIRTAEAFSLGTLYFKGMTALPRSKQVQDTSMGSHEWITWEPFNSFSALPSPVIALETCKDALTLSEFIFPETFTLVVGNEEYGCSDETLHAADIVLAIPLYGRKNSLNAANAFAIIASEIRRQNLLQIN
jgi:tRNA G18 (ribose-2'-O)-methylase SpoU